MTQSEFIPLHFALGTPTSARAVRASLVVVVVVVVRPVSVLEHTLLIGETGPSWLASMRSEGMPEAPTQE